MGRNRGRPRLKRWRGQPYIFWTDYSASPPQLRRTSCHAHKAYTREEQAALLNSFVVREKLHAAEAVKLGAAFDYDHSVLSAIDEYRRVVQERQRTKLQNPSALEGLSQASVKSILFTLGSLEEWLRQSGRSGLTTGKLDGTTLGQFFTWLARGSTRHGNKAVVRSAATLNKHKRNIKACLKFLNNRRPKLFPDFEILRDALRAQTQDLGPPASFSAAELTRFLSVALEYERGPMVYSVKRRKQGSTRVERFQQVRSSFSATPVSRVFLLLALTGWRKEEVIQLRWEHVRFDTGQIHIWDPKRRGMKHKLVPLAGAMEGDIAPTLLRLLKTWKAEAGDDPWVLPHRGLPAPLFPGYAWKQVNARTGLQRIGAQSLRQNFCSYAAALGVPPSIAALWQGHSASVAERYYRSQVQGAMRGRSMEEAMGLKTLMLQMLREKR